MEYNKNLISLHELLNKRKKLDEWMVKIIVKQIVNGLSYLKEKRIIHRDLHPGNILLKESINHPPAYFCNILF